MEGIEMQSNNLVGEERENLETNKQKKIDKKNLGIYKKVHPN